jgi:hypothetical protein
MAQRRTMDFLLVNRVEAAPQFKQELQRLT